MTVERFVIDIGATDWDDLRDRIRRTRWPDPAPGEPWSQGVDLAYLQGLMGYWADGFDWPRQQAWLNGYEHRHVDLADVRLHVVSAADGRGRGHLPLLLTHGWPSTFVELLPLLDRLCDSYEVVVVSPPGYPFSSRPASVGVDRAYVAEAYHRLMAALGHRRYGVCGGDFGAGVATSMALSRPEAVVGIHLSTAELAPYTGPGSPPLTDAERDFCARVAEWDSTERGYSSVQSTRPQTLGYALTDSPAGQLAWNAELWTGWGDYADYLDVDTYLTHVSIYWFTRTGVSSARHYYEDARSGAGYRDEPNRVPTAVAVFPQDFRTVRAFAERANNIVRYTEFDRGGHFAYTTDPDLVVADLREFFASLG